MSGIFNSNEGELFQGIRSDFAKSNDDFSLNKAAAPEAIEKDSVIDTIIADVTAGNRKFMFMNKPFFVHEEFNKATTLEELTPNGSVVVSQISSMHQLKETMGLIKASIELYPVEPTVNDALLKAARDLKSAQMKEEFSSRWGMLKAKKGTPEYEEWLRKYRAKKGVKEEEKKPEPKQKVYEAPKKETLKERKILAGVSTLNDSDISNALKDVPADGSKTVKVKGVDVTFETDDESTTVRVSSHKMHGGTKQAYYVNAPKDKLTKMDLGNIAKGVNKIINEYPDDYLPHR